MQLQHARSINIRRIASSASLATLIGILGIVIVLILALQAATSRADLPLARRAQSAPLGISRPAGVDVRTLPSGYSDYFLPHN